MYHAISGGRTEAAQTVFSQALPYLVSVESDGEEGVPGYRQDTFFTFDEMAALLGDAFDLDLTAQEVERTLAVAGYTDTGTRGRHAGGRQRGGGHGLPSGTWAAKHLVYNVHG